MDGPERQRFFAAGWEDEIGVKDVSQCGEELCTIHRGRPGVDGFEGQRTTGLWLRRFSLL